MPSVKKISSGFSQVETGDMLDVIEELLPIGGMEWDETKIRHANNWPETNRSKDSLKRKFQGMYRKTKPTGNPHCPPDITRAKRIHEMIVDKSDLSDGETINNFFDRDEGDLESSSDKSDDDVVVKNKEEVIVVDEIEEGTNSNV